MSRRQGPSVEELQRRGYLPTPEIVAAVNARGGEIKAAHLWFFQKEGIIPKPILGGLDSLRRRVSWYPASVVDSILARGRHKRPPGQRRRPATYAEALHEALMESAQKWWARLPAEARLPLEAEEIGKRPARLRQELHIVETVAGERPETEKTFRLHSPSLYREILRLRREHGDAFQTLARELRAQLETLSVEDLARDPLSTLEQAGALCRKPGGADALLLNDWIESFTEEMRHWTSGAVAAAVLAMRIIDVAYLHLVHGERGRALFALRQGVNHKSAALYLLNRDFKTPDRKPEEIPAQQAEGRTASP